MTKNGSGRGRVSPSLVTCCSSIASSRALWVLGVARLISSARTRWAKIGPGWKRNSPVPRSYTATPRMAARQQTGEGEADWMLLAQDNAAGLGNDLIQENMHASPFSGWVCGLIWGGEWDWQTTRSPPRIFSVLSLLFGATLWLFMKNHHHLPVAAGDLASYLGRHHPVAGAELDDGQLAAAELVGCLLGDKDPLDLVLFD